MEYTPTFLYIYIYVCIYIDLQIYTFSISKYVYKCAWGIHRCIYQSYKHYLKEKTYHIWSHIPEMLGMMVHRTTLEVVLAVVKGLEGHSRVSAYVIQAALLSYYTEAKLYPSGNLRGNPSSSRLGAQVWGGHQKTCFSPNSGFMCDIFFHDLPFPEKAIKKQSKWQFCFGHVILGFETSPVDATFKHIKAPKAYWDQTDCSEVWLGRGQIQSWHGFRFRFMVMDCRNIILLFLNVLTHQSSINGLYISDTSWLKV